MDYDDKLLPLLEKEMGWDKEKPTPSDIAKSKGLHCKFMDGVWSSTAWGNDKKGWSVCVLKGGPSTIGTTLLAKTFPALEKLYRKLREREKAGNLIKWQKYYSNMWRQRYKKWHCKGIHCSCQLCRGKIN